ncbi:MAG TPA: hypothetical protein VLC09_00060 [Polyangiaceae bacterium]|nr:hypothetical protein [Polyangiaceae bacterium]
MPRPWTLLDSTDTDEGALELRRRGDADYMISVGGRVLMTSMITRSELALAELGTERVRQLRAPRVLIGGLGLGFTLRAALDALPAQARVTVAELNPRVIDWCRGPASAAAGGAALDRRVGFFVGDVTHEIARVAEDPRAARYDAILWDLYVGPADDHRAERDPLYGTTSVRRTFQALSDGGTFAVWGESPTPSFLERLRKAGFEPRAVRTRGGGLHHIVFLADRAAAQRGAPANRPAAQRGASTDRPVAQRGASAHRPTAQRAPSLDRKPSRRRDPH